MAGEARAHGTSAVERELDRLMQDFLACHGDGYPRQPFDAQWRSPCQLGPPAPDGTIAWRPVRRDTAPDWSGLEAGLEVNLNPDVTTFYGRYWSDAVPVTAQEGAATLVQVWNERDHQRLVENLVGHALQQRRRRVALTLFIAITDESDFVLSVDNASGAVVLEQPGQPPQRQVAATLAELLARMSPVTAPGEPT